MIKKWIIKRFEPVLELVSRRLANKLILLFTIIIVLVVTSLTFISYGMLRKESVDNSIASTSNNLLLVGRNLESYLDGIEQLSLPQISYDEITYAILHESEDYASKMYVEDYLKNLYFSRNDLEAIYLYVIKEHKYYYVTKENYNITVRVAEHPSIENLSWYKKALASPFNRSYQSFVKNQSSMINSSDYPINKDKSFMGYHRLLRSIVSREPQAVLSLYFNSSVTDEIMKDIPFSKGQHLMYVSPDNEPFVVDDPGFYQQSEQEGLLKELTPASGGRVTWSDKEEKYLVIYDISKKEGWKLIKPIPYKEIYEAATTTRKLNYFIGLLFLIVSVILVSFISNKITNPLKNLSLQMKRFSTGSFDAEAQVEGKDEIAYLSRHFNKMVEKTNELINERYKMKIVEKNAVLKALEAEINPHFLYNALQAISTKALKNNNDDIVDMVDNLAMTLRYCISGKDVVHAREELKHIERYLALQKARFGNRMQVAYQWEDPLLELEIPKLSIQTLVENCIKHALEKVSTTITITIEAHVTPSHTVISVTDDGPGFSGERLEQVRNSLQIQWEDQGGENAAESDTESIGLKNLNTRLKLLYGEAAGLAITSDAGGTKMDMRLPRGGINHV
ncbi:MULTISPECIES: sensor histidine kinase [Paenibacillus]|uniref:sensor histidine kinase n=1 Tax=Paenibacillus TaxID=44249 RepID=UPI00068E172C|nr:histidine kinase [Paenibacillus odorifer]OMD02655.1 two-component sensor histidine kinase [Paenibacillus odorifer]OMD05781.1 two-component sensor histidine kinase [Paenibacillus odorifer]OME36768.1 two-component sensor histidine kinase [Paenibacillus odorifer]OZQ74656.1 two-component sensor histidine kinase [Paenibacillus odorifer]